MSISRKIEEYPRRDALKPRKMTSWRTSENAMPMTSTEIATTIRVAHIIPSIADQAAGPSYTVPALCRALAANHVDVELHVLGSGAEPLNSARDFVLHKHPRSARLLPIDSSRAMRRTLESRAGEIDVFHSHGLWRMPGLYAARAARSASKPLVVTPRGMLESAALRFSGRQKRLFWALGQGRAVLDSDCLHVTSEAELQTLRDLGFRNPVAVVANGVHLPKIEPRHPGTCVRRTVLYLGRIHPIKALDRLVEAWAQVEARHVDWQLRLVGPSSAGYGETLRRRCSDLGLRRVTFGEAAFAEAKERELSAAGLFVLASHSENFGMSVAEAMASGVPVLASTGTPWEQVTEHHCGSWVANVPASLARALDGLLSLSDLERTEMGARGREWMERDFGWNQKAAQMAEVYAWICDRRRPRPASVDLARDANQEGGSVIGAWKAPW